MNRNTRRYGIETPGGDVSGGPYCRPAKEYATYPVSITPGGPEPYVNRGFTRTTYWQNSTDKAPIDPRQEGYYSGTAKPIRQQARGVNRGSIKKR